MIRPANKGEDGGPNPNWYQGNEWQFRTNGKRQEWELSLRTKSSNGKPITIELTDAQAAKLLYAAQAGELDDYGEYRD